MVRLVIIKRGSWQGPCREARTPFGTLGEESGVKTPETGQNGRKRVCLALSGVLAGRRHVGLALWGEFSERRHVSPPLDDHLEARKHVSPALKVAGLGRRRVCLPRGVDRKVATTCVFAPRGR